jgi:uncharacterized MnhB-related membrane protein
MTLEIVLLVALVLAALWTVSSARVMRAVIGLAVTSVVLTMIMFRLNSPVAGVFELSVCAGLIPAIFISTISLTHRLTTETLADRRRELLRRFWLLPMDSTRYCQCPECKRLDSPLKDDPVPFVSGAPYSTSGSYYHFVCEVAKGLREVATLLVADVIAHLAGRGITLEVPEQTVEWLLGHAGGEASAGARPLRRAVQRYLEDAVSDYLISHRQVSDEPLHACVEADRLVVATGEGVCEQ